MREFFKKKKKRSPVFVRRKEKGHVVSLLTQSCTWPVCVRISVSFFPESGVKVKWTEDISWFCGMELR